MLARIYQPAKTAMQSGRARTRKWLLEYEPETPRQIEPLMGWTASTDMRSQVSLEFETLDEAVAYAKANNIPYQVFEAHKPSAKAKSYSDNFRFGRKVPWTH
jgi:ETC complex I subunit conserved region